LGKVLLFATYFCTDKLNIRPLMGICASTKHPIGHCSKFGVSSRVQILTPASAFQLFLNEESPNLNVECSRTYPPVSAKVVSLVEEKSFNGEFKSEHDTGRQMLTRQQEYQESVLPENYNQEWPSEHQFPEFSSDSEASQEIWSPRPRQAREQSGIPSQLQTYRRLSSVLFEGELQSDTNDHFLPSVPGFQKVAQGGFTKPAFREFVEKIPGSNSHRAVVLAEFEQLWSILSGGDEKIPLSRLLDFYNKEKSREERCSKIVKPSNGSVKYVTNDLNISNYSKRSMSILDMRRDNIGPGFNIQRESDGMSQPAELAMNHWYHRKIQTSINNKDGYQHQLTLGALDQEQSEEDGLEMRRRLSGDSSSTKTLSYPSTNMQAQIIQENVDDDRINESPSIKVSKSIALNEPFRLSSSDQIKTLPEICSLQKSTQNVIQVNTLSQNDRSVEMDVEHYDPDYSQKEDPEYFQDFVFLSGSKPMKRKRICRKLPVSRVDRARGYWEWFEDLDRVSNQDHICKPDRQRPQNSSKQPRGKDSLFPTVLDSKRMAFACSKCNLPQYVGEDIVAALIAGEKLSTVDLLNRYGQAASIESLKRFYKLNCSNVADKMPPPQSMIL